MSGDVLGTHFWGGLIPTRFKSGFSLDILVFLVFPVYTGFFSFLGDPDETWNLQPLVSTSHSGLLIWMRGVLQGVSGGALWVVR